MSKLEYLNPSDWSLHVIDGENECVPEGWVKLPKEADFLAKSSDGLSIWAKGIQFDVNRSGYVKKSNYTFDQEWWINRNNPEILWTRKMKEYLVKRDGKYELVEAYHLDGGIEVPEGAITATINGKAGDLLFWRKHETHYCFNPEDTDGWFVGADKLEEYLSYWSDSKIIWQRNQSLSDKSKGIEAYISIDKSTLKDIKDRADIFCKETSKHHHYFKNVQNLNMIDVYRVLELFDVQSHAVGHAVKKLLCSGGRGSKDYLQDVQEAIDSLQREIEMKKEDSK